MALVLLSLISFNLTNGFLSVLTVSEMVIFDSFFIFLLLSVVDTVVMRDVAMSPHTSSAILYVCFFLLFIACSITRSNTTCLIL